MCNFRDVIKILLGNGRAWLMPTGGMVDKIFTALSKEPENICQYFNKVRDIGIPGKIPESGLDYWESDLALTKQMSMSVQQRNERIIAKLYATGGQSKYYIQSIIQSAGYNMYITENNPVENPDVRSYTTTLGSFTLGSGATLGAYTDRIDPRTVIGTLIAGPDIYESYKNYSSTLGGFTLGSGAKLGTYTSTQTVSYQYVIPPNPAYYGLVWFLHGSLGLGNFVDMSQEQFNELKRIILEIKPAHTWIVVQANII